MMHIVEVTTKEVYCSCTFEKETITASEARRVGYIHAAACTPSIVIDHTKEK